MNKKMTLIVLIAIAAVFAGSALAASDHTDSWRVVKRAVQNDDSRHETGSREARWFKILIVDRHGNESVKITLPLSLVEGIVELASDEHFKCDGHETDIELSDILHALRKGGPMSLVEISDHDGLIKVWIE